MNLSIEDLQMLMAYLAKNSTAYTVRLTTDGNEARFTTMDKDGKLVSIMLWDVESRNMPKVTGSEYLKVALKGGG